MATFRQLLVPIDFGAPSNRALELGIELAGQFEAELTIAHFWELPPYPYAGSAYSSPDLITELGRGADEHLANAVLRAQQKLPRTKGVCRMGLPWQEILHLIEEARVDLVVMGTHGRRGISRALLGSVAERVVRSSPVPVLIVPAQPT